LFTDDDMDILREKERAPVLVARDPTSKAASGE